MAIKLTTTTTPAPFPYGTVPVDPAFAACYTDAYSRASSYPLPDALPAHHPLLRDLEGTYPLTYTLPPWWPTCLTQITSTTLKPLLASVSPQEFREGCLEQARWKSFRETLSARERHELPASPKILALLAEAGVEREDADRFVMRGPVTTPEQLTLRISTQPLDFLYMANGQEWSSCQHWRTGQLNYLLPGNFFDTNVAIATVLATGTQVEDDASVLARTTIRVFRDGEQIVVALGRTYHNNTTLAFLLLRKLAEIFDQHHLTWGILTDINTLAYCQDGSLGADLAARCGQPASYLDGETCWFPSNWYQPYVDGGDREWKWESGPQNGYYSVHLTAAVKLMRPPATIALPLPMLRLPARLAPLSVTPLLR